jgi:thiol-disulfide isomerase/thioredoxin
MKGKIILVLIFTISVLGLKAQGIEFFQGSWKDALAKAKSEDKLLFVDAFAKWCGPCKAMAKNVFTQQKVGDFYNANFINLKLDMEETDGVTFGHKYPVAAYPTLFFLDGDGKVIKKVTGGQQPDGLIMQGEDALKKNDKSGKYEEKYMAGDRSFDLMLNYIKALNAAGKQSLKISNEYLNSNPAITENQKLTFILEAAVDADSKLFEQVMINKSKMVSLLSQKTYEEKCLAACQVAVNKAIEYEMESLLTETIEKAKKTFPDGADVFSAKANMQFYKAFKNENKYISAYKSLAKKADGDLVMLKYIIQDVVKNFKENPKMVSDATDFAEKLYEKTEDTESLNLYCSLLILNKEVDKAIKIVTTAKEKAEKNGQELSNYDGLLNYLNSKKT